MTFRTERVSSFGGIQTRSRLNDQQDRLFQELQQQRPFQAFLGQLKLQKDPIFTRYESNTPKVILFLKKPATINGIRFRADEHTLDEKELQTLFGNSRTYQIIEQLCLNSSEPSMRESKNRPFSPSSVETELEDTAIPPYKFSAKLLRDSEEREQKLLAALDQSERRFLAALSESEQRYSELCKQLIALVASTMIPQQPLGQNHSIQPMSSYENQLEQIAKTFPHLKLPPVDATNPSQIIPTAPMAETIVPVMPKRPVVELAPQDPDEPSALSQDDKDTELESDDVVPFSSSHSPEQRSIVIPSASQPETVSVDVHSEHSSVSPTPSTDEEEFIESSRNLDDQAPVDTIAFSWKNSFFTAPPSREEILQNLQREWTDLQASPATNLTERRSFLTRLLPAQELDAERQIEQLEDQLIAATKEETPNLEAGSLKEKIQKYTRALANAKEVQLLQNQVLAEIAKRYDAYRNPTKAGLTVQQAQRQRLEEVQELMDANNPTELYAAAREERVRLQRAKRDLDQARAREHELIMNISKLSAPDKRTDLGRLPNPTLDRSVRECLANEPFNPDEMGAPASWMNRSLQQQQIRLTREVEAELTRVQTHNQEKLYPQLAALESEKQKGYGAFDGLSARQLARQASEMYNELIAHRRELANAKDALEAAQQETRAILSEFSRRSINPIVGEKPTTTELKKTVLEYLAEIPSNPTENAGLSARDARLLRLRLDLALRFTKQTHKATEAVQQYNQQLRAQLPPMSSTPTKVKERLRRTVASSSAAHSVALESFRSPVSEEEFNIDGWT